MLAYCRVGVVFTSHLHGLHLRLQVIWYDSVTVHGDLKWQDELNELNLDFFALTDGMYFTRRPLRSPCYNTRSTFRVHRGWDFRY
jgi:hypothetical protein